MNTSTTPGPPRRPRSTPSSTPRPPRESGRRIGSSSPSSSGKCPVRRCSAAGRLHRRCAARGGPTGSSRGASWTEPTPTRSPPGWAVNLRCRPGRRYRHGDAGGRRVGPRPTGLCGLTWLMPTAEGPEHQLTERPLTPKTITALTSSPTTCSSVWVKVAHRINHPSTRLDGVVPACAGRETRLRPSPVDALLLEADALAVAVSDQILVQRCLLDAQPVEPGGCGRRLA